MKKTNNEMWVYVGKQNENDPLSLMLSTEKNGTFVSNSGTKNRSNKVSDLNMVCVSGDKNYISKYMTDWFISISNQVISSRLVSNADGYGVIGITKQHPVRLVGNGKIHDLSLLSKMVFELISFNENVRVISMTGHGGFIVEDDTGNAMITNNMIDLNHCIKKQETERAQINQ